MLPALVKQLAAWAQRDDDQAAAAMPRGWAGRLDRAGGQEHVLPVQARWANRTWGWLAHLILSLCSQAWMTDAELLGLGQLAPTNWLTAAPPAPGAADVETARLDALHHAQRVHLLQGREHTNIRCMLINQQGLHPQARLLPEACRLHPTSKLYTRSPATRHAARGVRRYMRVHLAAGVHEYAHRLLAWLRLGPPPLHPATGRPLEAVHTCENKCCLNPYHIVWVGVR